MGLHQEMCICKIIVSIHPTEFGELFLIVMGYIPTHARFETLTPNLLPLLVLPSGCGCPEHLAYGVTLW